MSEPITVLVGSGNHQRETAEALLEGFKRHGVAATLRPAHGERPQTRRVVCWGWHKGAPLHAAGHEVLVMERAYLGNRFEWISLGWNGLNGRADFGRIPDDGGARFKRHFGDLMKPWNPVGDYVLIVGQVQGDASLRGLSLKDWYQTQATQLSGAKKFRPHPEAVKRGQNLHVPRGVQHLMGGTLDAALAGASLVTTYNSNVGVDSLLAGKPTLIEDSGSMAWTLRDQIDEPDRMAWAAQLAWKQWLPKEIASGLAWECIGRDV